MALVRRKRRETWIICVIGTFVISSLAGMASIVGERSNLGSEVGYVDDNQHDVAGGRLPGRSLAGFAHEPDMNCTPPAIEQFPPTFFTPEQRKQGAVMVHILIAAYMFLALAIVCDEYFVPACERICDVLKLQSDVAGATFMAAGSSAPELATAVIGVFIAKDDIGIGAVVGSAVFNIMFVISICALFAGSVVYLNWWPMFRDCFFYTLSIIALVGVIYDGYVTWYEALILLVLYVLYIVLMVLNPRLEAAIVPHFTCCGARRDDDNTELIGINSTKQEANHHTFEEGGTDEEETNPAAVKPDNDDGDEESVLSFPEGCGKRTLWIISLPLTLLMFCTIPDCRRSRWAKWWCVTFTMSIVWIGAFSYIMVWMITIIGHTFSIPDTAMGLTFIAAGASVPDAIASVLVIRDGYGDMAVSNAVGSNVFDILLCLGLPYFLKSLVVNFGEPVIVYSSGLTYSALTLLSTVVFLLVSVHVNGWKLDIKYGVLLMIVYVAFNVLAILYELNVFGYVHPPDCPSIW